MGIIQYIGIPILISHSSVVDSLETCNGRAMLPRLSFHKRAVSHLNENSNANFAKKAREANTKLLN